MVYDCTPSILDTKKYSIGRCSFRISPMYTLYYTLSSVRNRIYELQFNSGVSNLSISVYNLDSSCSHSNLPWLYQYSSSLFGVSSRLEYSMYVSLCSRTCSCSWSICLYADHIVLWWIFTIQWPQTSFPCFLPAFGPQLRLQLVHFFLKDIFISYIVCRQASLMMNYTDLLQRLHLYLFSPLNTPFLITRPLSQ